MHELRLDIHKSLFALSQLLDCTIDNCAGFIPSYNIGYGRSIPVLHDRTLTTLTFEPNFLDSSSLPPCASPPLFRCAVPIFGVFRIDDPPYAYYSPLPSLCFVPGLVDSHHRLSVVINSFSDDNICNFRPIVLTRAQCSAWLIGELSDLRPLHYANYAGQYPVSRQILIRGYSGQICTELEAHLADTRVRGNLLSFLKRNKRPRAAILALH